MLKRPASSNYWRPAGVLFAFDRAKTDQVRLQIADEIPLIQTDAGKVQQILYNLLSNAIKFTPENGRIVIKAVMLDDVTVRISVSDTGPGISPEDQARSLKNSFNLMAP